MFCPRCGQELVDDALFCSSCGTKLDFLRNSGYTREDISYDRFRQDGTDSPDADFFEEEEIVEDRYNDYETDLNDYYNDEPAPKKNRKPLIIVLCAVVAAVVIGAAVFASGKIGGGGPEDKLKSASEKTMSAIAGRSEVTNFFYGLKDADKLGVTIRAENLGDMLSSVSPYLAYMNMDAEIAAAGDRKGNLSATLDVNAFGSKIRAGYYAAESGDGDLVVDIPSVLEDPYGISFKNIGEDLENSIFAPGSGSSYEMPASSFSELKTALESVGKAGSTISALDIKELAEELQKNDATKIKYEKSKEETDAGDGTVKCDVYATSIDEEKICAILECIGDWLEKKDGLEDNELILSLMDSMGFGSITPAEFIDRMVEEIGKTDVKLDVRSYVYKGYLVKSVIDGEVDGHEISAVTTFGSDPSKTDEVLTVIKAEDQDITLKADLSKADQNAFKISVKSKEMGLNAKLGFEYDKDNSEFELTADSGSGDNLVLTGGMTVGKDSFTISDPEVKYSGYLNLKLKGLSIELSKAPAIRKCKDEYPNGYTNILRLSESELEDIAGQIQQLGSTLGSLIN